jgi:hypothetical protein
LSQSYRDLHATGQSEDASKRQRRKPGIHSSYHQYSSALLQLNRQMIDWLVHLEMVREAE